MSTPMFDHTSFRARIAADNLQPVLHTYVNGVPINYNILDMPPSVFAGFCIMQAYIGASCVREKTKRRRD